MEAEKAGLKNQIDLLKAATPTAKNHDQLGWSTVPDLADAEFDNRTTEQFLKEIDALRVARGWPSPPQGDPNIGLLEGHSVDPAEEIYKAAVGKRFDWIIETLDAYPLRQGDLRLVRFTAVFNRPVRLPSGEDGLDMSSPAGGFYFRGSGAGDLSKVRQGDKIKVSGVFTEFRTMVKCELLEIIPRPESTLESLSEAEKTRWFRER